MEQSQQNTSSIEKSKAAKGDFKPYTYTNLRSRNARLCYRRGDREDWTRLDDSYELPGVDKAEYAE